MRAAKSRGAIVLPQLQFPGRQVPEFLNKEPRSASDVQLKPCLNKTYGKPKALSIGEIQELIGRYVWAAEVLAKAGADGIIVSRSNERSRCFNETDRSCSFMPPMATS
jgi:2,4-dienoyl-CoA reductase-like NADH-dependent reductase (Old Yellow Enzyme family)